jgi:hypothetical protein
VTPLVQRESCEALEATADTAVAHTPSITVSTIVCHGCVSRADASQKGWKPQFQNDPLIDNLFDLYWPVEPKNQPPGAH